MEKKTKKNWRESTRRERSAERKTENNKKLTETVKPKKKAQKRTNVGQMDYCNGERGVVSWGGPRHPMQQKCHPERARWLGVGYPYQASARVKCTIEFGSI